MLLSLAEGAGSRNPLLDTIGSWLLEHMVLAAIGCVVESRAVWALADHETWQVLR